MRWDFRTMKWSLLPCSVVLAFLSSAPLQAQNWRHPERDSIVYRYPMRIDPEISGSFAELRATHFHGGIDYRTRQKEGIKVFSAAPGYIVRATVEKGSYGNALYVWHPNGTLSVYGHLRKFSQPVRRQVKRLQRRSGNFEQSLDGLYVKTRKNRAIARSGNTGASGGPHLHFEILRDSVRLNPAIFGLGVADTVAPELLWFAFYTRPNQADTGLPGRIAATMAEHEAFQAAEASPRTATEGDFMGAPLLDFRMEKALEAELDSLQELLALQHDTLPSRNFADLYLEHPDLEEKPWQAWYYRLENLPDTILVNQEAAFGLCALDRIQQMPFHYGLYRLAFLIEEAEATGTGHEESSSTSGPATLPDGVTPLDGESPNSVQTGDTLAFYQLDYLPVRTCKEIHLHIDTLFYQATRNRLEKSYLYPGQQHTPYRKLGNRGIFVPEKGKTYRLVLVAEDFAGNRSRIRVVLKSR